jgi:hypothetical protein
VCLALFSLRYFTTQFVVHHLPLHHDDRIIRMTQGAGGKQKVPVHLAALSLLNRHLRHIQCGLELVQLPAHLGQPDKVLQRLQ